LGHYKTEPRAQTERERERERGVHNIYLYNICNIYNMKNEKSSPTKMPSHFFLNPTPIFLVVNKLIFSYYSESSL